jgi:hypothetical protein
VLDGLERKLVAVVGDAMAGRSHLDVVQLAGPGDEPAAGRVAVRVGVESVSPETGFDRDVIALSGPKEAPLSRRVLPVRFTAAARFAARPEGTAATQRAAARTLLLGDVSAVAHALAAAPFLAGAAFDSAGDPGFEVTAFSLAGGDLDPVPTEGTVEGLLAATVRWDGRARVWPISPPEPEGVVRGVDVELVPVPLALSTRDPVVRQGGSTIVTIDGVAGRRITGLDPPTDEPIAIAVSVTSDLPPADRGRIDGGAAGTPEGVRVVPVTGLGTTVTYSAPTASLGATSVEFVAVHLATREGERGAFLDALPIRLVPA